MLPAGHRLCPAGKTHTVTPGIRCGLRLERRPLLPGRPGPRTERTDQKPLKHMKKLLLAAALLVAMSGCTLSEQTETEVICPPQADNGIDIEPWHPSDDCTDIGK